MLFGELIIIDGVIAFALNMSKERCIVDLAAACQDLKMDREVLVRVLCCMMSFTSVMIIANLPLKMCYNSPVDDELNWALTSCPDMPKNITEMSRVSA